MKVRILLDEQGEVAAIERPQRGAPRKDPDAPQAGGGVEARGQKFYDIEVPDDLDKVESAEEFHSRIKPHVDKIKR